jgi:hypothetical protein
VVTVYRPLLNRTGVLSVWNQQKSYFKTIKEDRCPREMFVQDLAVETAKWLEAGDQLVIGGNINKDVRKCGLTGKLNDMGMIEILTTIHGTEGPSTYNRGSTPIDGIYVAHTLHGLRCGYNKFVWDHRLLWIDLPLTVAFGHNVPPIVRASARRLKSEDPRIVKRYLDEFTAWINQLGLLEKARRLQDNTSIMSDGLLKMEYDRLDQIRFDAMMFADQHCGKLKMGAEQWSPNYQAV